MLAKGGEVLEGSLRTTNALIFDSETKFSGPYMKMIQVKITKLVTQKYVIFNFSL